MILRPNVVTYSIKKVQSRVPLLVVPRGAGQRFTLCPRTWSLSVLN